ncbi:MAG: hypothetical protein N3G21_09410 [Candidatus Hydrogenedentes bacterium]|nr:hypothetical protein [Candidatus Hydrogenedentota bacterium]
MNIVTSRISFPKISRFTEILLGIVFFISGYSKLIEINKFTVQIYSYGVIFYKPILPWIALCVVLLELILAVLLSFGIKHKRILHLFILFLLFSFSGLILYGWFFHNLKDCGCFGKIEMGPGSSLIKNAILLILTSYCLIMAGKTVSYKENSHLIKFKIITLLAVLISGFVMGYSSLRKETSFVSVDSDTSFPNLLIGMNFEVDGKVYDLSNGEYLVALLSFGCDHCIEEAPKLNDYLLLQNIPPLVAVCLEESSEEKEYFFAKVGPQFPTYSLGNKPILFLSMIGKEPPRLVHIKNGSVLKMWDYNLPEVEELGRYFSSLK